MTKRICISLITLILIWSCDPFDNRLTFYNKSNATVVPFVLAWTSDEEIYKEFDLNSLKEEFRDNPIAPMSKRSFSLMGNWETYFINDALVSVVLDQNDLQVKGLNRKIREYKIVSKIKVSRTYIKRNNWQINMDSSDSHNFVKL